MVSTNRLSRSRAVTEQQSKCELNTNELCIEYKSAMYPGNSLSAIMT